MHLLFRVHFNLKLFDDGADVGFVLLFSLYRFLEEVFPEISHLVNVFLTHLDFVDEALKVAPLIFEFLRHALDVPFDHIEVPFGGSLTDLVSMINSAHVEVLLEHLILQLLRFSSHFV